MKTFNFSKQDLDYLVPVEANKQALETAVKVYILNVVMPRLGLKQSDAVRYDITKGELQLIDPNPPATAKEEAKVEQPEAEHKAVVTDAKK